MFKFKIKNVFLVYAGEQTPAALKLGDLTVFLPRKLTWFERRFGLRVPYYELPGPAKPEKDNS